MSTFTGQENRDISLMRAIVCKTKLNPVIPATDGRPYPLGIDQSGYDADNRNQSDAKRIIIVIIQRPQNYARDLEYVEWVDDLKQRTPSVIEKNHFKNGRLPHR
jgi:hypothetical protein